MFHRRPAIAVLAPREYIEKHNDVATGIRSVHDTLEAALHALDLTPRSNVVAEPFPELISVDIISLDQHPGLGLVVSSPEHRPGEMVVAVIADGAVTPIGQHGLSIPKMLVKDLEQHIKYQSDKSDWSPGSVGIDKIVLFLIDLCRELGEPLLGGAGEAVHKFVVQMGVVRALTQQVTDCWNSAVSQSELPESPVHPGTISESGWLAVFDKRTDGTEGGWSLWPTQQVAERKVAWLQAGRGQASHLPMTVWPVVVLRDTAYPEVAIAIRQTDNGYHAHFVSPEPLRRTLEVVEETGPWPDPPTAMLALTPLLTRQRYWLGVTARIYGRAVHYVDIPLKALTVYGKTMPEDARVTLQTWKQAATDLVTAHILATDTLERHHHMMDDAAN